jgi:REP element-mobilizing transposase RayT
LGHGLVVPGAIRTLSSAVQAFKSASSRHVNRVRGSTGPVWAPGFHDHALRRDGDLATVARYVVADPVRAGLVRRVGDYPFWDSVWLD